MAVRSRVQKIDQGILLFPVFVVQTSVLTMCFFNFLYVLRFDYSILLKARQVVQLIQESFTLHIHELVLR